VEPHPSLDERGEVRKKEGANLGIAFRCVKEDQTALDTGKCREKRLV